MFDILTLYELNVKTTKRLASKQSQEMASRKLHLGQASVGTITSSTRCNRLQPPYVSLFPPQRYMYLTPATLEATVRLLDEPGNVPAVGDMVETERVLMTN